MMRTVVAAPLRPWAFTLQAVAQEQARHEWQFLLPFANAARPFSRFALASCFEMHGGADGARYADQLRRLPLARLHGFLTGFVDLVFRHQDRWYVVDWKSNQLGADPAAYEHDALRPVMEASHYTLQYHLYLTALHRHLTARLPEYDYARHMGGAAYAFLRGFSAESALTGLGWFTDLPSRALIEALSRLMDRTATRPEVA
jgi:exodeoxyribonuclease V beta subunit